MYSDLKFETPCSMHNLHHIIRWEGDRDWPILPVCQGQPIRKLALKFSHHTPSSYFLESESAIQPTHTNRQIHLSLSSSHTYTIIEGGIPKNYFYIGWGYSGEEFNPRSGFYLFISMSPSESSPLKFSFQKHVRKCKGYLPNMRGNST